MDDDYLGGGVEEDAGELRRVVAPGCGRGRIWRRVTLTETQ